MGNAVAFRAEIVESKLNDALARLGSMKEAKKVIGRSMYEIAKQARTELKQKIGDEITLKKGSILKMLSIANIPQSSGSFGKILKIRGRRPGLVKYGASTTKKGVSYRIAKGTPRKLLRHNFILETEGAGNTVFRAVVQRQGKERYPLSKTKKGPSVPAVYQNQDNKVEASFLKDVNSMFAKKVDALIDVELSRRSANVTH